MLSSFKTSMQVNMKGLFAFNCQGGPFLTQSPCNTRHRITISPMASERVTYNSRSKILDEIPDPAPEPWRELEIYNSRALTFRILARTRDHGGGVIQQLSSCKVAFFVIDLQPDLPISPPHATAHLGDKIAFLCFRV